VLPVDLPGHGGAGQPTEPAAYADVPGQVAERIAAVAGDAQVDAVGFSAGAETLLAVAAADPGRFRRLAVLGIGSPVLDAAGDGTEELARALEGEPDPADIRARVFRRMAENAGNDPAALAAFLRRPRRRLTAEDLSGVRCPVLVVLGDRDFAGSADRLVAVLPDAELVTLRGVDHFGTTADHRCLTAVLRFLDGGAED
jgi:pimeloyl-ACP methyl ester carboxylesterase